MSAAEDRVPSAYLPLDPAASSELRDLLALAAAALDVPAAWVAVAAGERPWLKSELGLDTRTPRPELDACVELLQNTELRVIPDATLDANLAHHEHVLGEPHLRFLAAATLRLGGKRIGVLCATDTAPHPRGNREHLLGLLAGQVVRLLESRRERLVAAARAEKRRVFQAQQEEELVAAQSRLQERELRLNALLDAMEEGVVVQDASGSVVGSNVAARRILNLSGAELEKHSAHQAPLAPLMRRDKSPMPDAERPAAYVLRTGETVTDRVMGMRLDDERTLWLSCNATPLRARPDLPVRGVVLTFRDITQHVVLQEALERSLEQFRALMTSLPVGVAISHGRTMRFVNQALADILGYDSPAELEGNETLMVVHPGSLDAILERYAGMARGQFPGPGVLECRKRDGSPVLVEVTSMPTTFEDRPAILAIIRDVTESARAKQAQERSEARLIESLAEKETLLQEIHHRVKNNLQVIASLLRIGRGYVKDAHSLSVFNDSIARVHSIALIHERLYRSHDLARIDMGDYLRGLLAELVRANATQQRISTQVLVDRQYFDIDRCVPIGLIVGELVSNALKHAFNTASSAAPTISISLEERPASYELTVRDNGVGIDTSLAREDSLGLRIVASLVKQLDGEHRVESVGGTVWRIHFPQRSRDTEA